jgi:hypothetical protein
MARTRTGIPAGPAKEEAEEEAAMTDTKCYICGDCWWQGCPNDADYQMHVDLKRKGLPLFSGSVELCGGHKDQVHTNGGRMDLKWEAVEQALSMQRVKA